MSSSVLVGKNDQTYPVYVLNIIQTVHGTLLENSQFHKKESKSFSGVYDFLRVLEQIKKEENPLNVDELSVFYDHLYYRQPVWSVIDAVLTEELGKHYPLAFVLAKSPKWRVDWFQEILGLSFIYEIVKAKTNLYMKGLKEIGVDVGLREDGNEKPIVVLFNNEKVGKNARLTAEKVVQKLLEAVTIHVERFLADHYSYPKDAQPDF